MQQHSTSPSPAARLVMEAAERIRLETPEEILSGLDREGVKEIWQLEYLDSYQWESLQAPMGLVTSIRRSLQERKNHPPPSEPQQTQQRRGRMSPIRASVKLPRTSAKVITAGDLLAIPTQQMSGISAITDPEGRSMSIISMDDQMQQAMACSPTTPNNNNNGKATLRSSSKSPLRGRPKSPLSPPKSPVPPSLQQPEESINTFFPPTRPERMSSRDDWSIDDEDLLNAKNDPWTGCNTPGNLKNFGTAPKQPTRLCSIEPAVRRIEPPLLEASSGEADLPMPGNKPALAAAQGDAPLQRAPSDESGRSGASSDYDVAMKGYQWTVGRALGGPSNVDSSAPVLPTRMASDEPARSVSTETTTEERVAAAASKAIPKINSAPVRMQRDLVDFDDTCSC